MNNNIINGKLLADKILQEASITIQQLHSAKKRLPALAVVVVGENPASEIYVRNKKNACTKVGIKSIEYALPEDATEYGLLNLIAELNHDKNIDGILVQLPLPPHLDSKLVINAINPIKDVDGFHRYNIGSLTVQDPSICPCTPHGIIHMLDSINFEYSGKNAVVIGTSNIVGRPMALELLNRGATVTMCNNKTINLPQYTILADLIVIAIGQPKFLKKEWIKENCVVIDVGINRLSDNTICGDTDFDDIVDKVSYITPVPGGVGPMTIAILIKNTLECYNLHTL